MQPDTRELLEKAQENAHWMFSEEEIAILCNVPQVIVGQVATAPDSPFFMNKCRPEWFVEWMRRHADFGTADAATQRSPSMGAPQGSTGVNPWAEARRPSGGQKER
jgi:hypothetical protein